MTEHDAAYTALNARLSKVWETYRAVADEAGSMTLLALAHLARWEYPTAVSVAMSESDQGGGNMSFTAVMLPDDVEIEEPDDQDAYDELCMGIQALDLQHFDYWDEHGGRRSGSHGYLLIDKVIEGIGPQFKAFLAGATDPMPDPNDKPALLAWLEEKTS